MVRLLVGMPPETPTYYESQVETLVRACYGGDDIQATFCRDKEDFKEAYYSSPVDIVITIDNVRRDLGYSGVIGKRTGSEKFIVVVPGECRGDEVLLELIRRGFYNILFQQDFATGIRSLINRNRSLDDVLNYCGVYFGGGSANNRDSQMPAVRETLPSERTEERRHGSSIKRRYLGAGIGLIQLLGKDADVLMVKDVEEEEFSLDRFSRFELTEEEKGAQMPYREYKVDPDWVEKAKNTLKDRIRKVNLLLLNGNDSSFSKEEVRKVVMDELDHMRITGENAELVYASFVRDVYSYGRLDVLIHDPDVSDVRMMDFETVNVQSRGQWYRTNVKFADKKEYENFIQHICNKNNVPFNWTAADVVFPDEKSFEGECMLRDAFTNSNLNVNRTMSGHIRITRKIKKLMPELLADGFLTKPEAGLLFDFAKRKQSMIICGGSGSGKTVLLNCLIEFLPKDICGEIVQESSELFAPNHLNIKSSNSIESKGAETKVEHNLKALAEKALLRNTDVFCIGEIKGNEAADFYSASRTTTVFTTLHADNCFGAIPRCAELALAARAAATKEEIISVLARTIKVVVYCEHYKVKQIAEVKGYDEKAHDVRYVLYDFNAKEGN
ncbi:MAG: Flp pilus assembly complex ATPase component TadA [Lachnospiraceae bacterium]|nr:Flp pilus assembly complex ATPase component TadA [Lachnospiraceae bacterium]